MLFVYVLVHIREILFVVWYHVLRRVVKKQQ